MSLSPTQRSIVVIACLEAEGNLPKLHTAIERGFADGLSVAQIKEVLSQLYAYTGFPRSLNALNLLQAIETKHRQDGQPLYEGRDADPLPDSYDALVEGTKVQTQLCGGVPFNYAYAPATDYYLKAHLFGDIFARNNLTFAERELATVGALCGLSGVAPQRLAHIRGALEMGVSEAQLREMPDMLATYVGEKEAHRLATSLQQHFEGSVDAADLANRYLVGVEDSPYPIGLPNDAFAQYFTGQSFIAPLDAENGGPINVTFEPRCRNNWHIHHKQVQVLVCVSGRGWYQEWGKEPVELRPGVVVTIPAEAKHWHGAAKDSWMQHLTYHTHLQDGASNEWLEPVGDDHYDQLP